MEITVIDNELLLRAYGLLKSCKQHLRMCESYIVSNNSLGFTFMTLAYSNYSDLKSINFSKKLPYTSITFTPFFKAFDNYKKEVELQVTSPNNPKDFESQLLYKKLYTSIVDLEKKFEEKIPAYHHI